MEKTQEQIDTENIDAAIKILERPLSDLNLVLTTHNHEGELKQIVRHLRDRAALQYLKKMKELDSHFREHSFVTEPAHRIN